jgi:sugar/nucleoside kinase (ribokinase family)
VSGTIVAIGDTLLQLISSQLQESAYQHTLIVDSANAEYGGAAWNVAWNLDQLGWTTRMLAQHGTDAVGRFPPLPVSGRDALEPFWRKRTRTDQLLVFPNIAMPAIFLAGGLSQDELNSMFTDPGGYAATIFAGSRHHELRRRTLDTLFSQSGGLRVFSPSYTIHEYGHEELTAFLARADIVIVNRREAAFLAHVFAADEAAAMARTRIAGIVTCDEDGATIYPARGAAFHLPSTSGVRGDVIGAGDAFLSGFVDGFLRTRNVAAAARAGIEVSAQTARSGRVCTVLDAAQARAVSCEGE